MVRIATGNELRRIRTFIRPDGTETTPEEYFARFKSPNVVESGNDSSTEGGKKKKRTKKVS